MFDVSTFLIRWLFLSNLARDVAELQTLPCRPYQPPPPPPPLHPHDDNGRPQQSRQQVEETWRDDCIRGILSHPAGMQRLLVLDAYRVELVKNLAKTLKDSDETIKRRNLAEEFTLLHSRRRKDDEKHDEEEEEGEDEDSGSSEDDADEDDPYLDADLEILEAFAAGRAQTARSSVDEERNEGDEISTTVRQQQQQQQRQHSDNNNLRSREATLVISRTGARTIVGNDDSETYYSSSHVSRTRAAFLPRHRLDQQQQQDLLPPSPQEILEAKNVRRDVRDYLPQLVSAVLRAPPAFDPNLVNPSRRLRQLILRRCLQDPSWGIELCWLIEAEVGRAWKTLFEHRQQTGRRLIVVLPAEKAAVLAKIGTEKREAFDLLQDAEQATAYGYVAPDDEYANSDRYPHNTDQTTTAAEGGDEHHLNARLPSSLSLRRCSHFGDTMHFIDRLTQISLDLRMVPVLQRRAHLQEALHEMNRRIRRRMVTHGEVSLDVEDNLNPHDWPSLQDLSVDMLRYSVHFPLAPQTGTWPDGQPRPIASQDLPPSTEVVRVLNIVVPEAKILASRERCPYLVHLEVADTHLEGTDARLYASGASDLGATMDEALGMSAAASAAAASMRNWQGHPGYRIPDELLVKDSLPQRKSSQIASDHERGDRLFSRGGWQDSEFIDEGNVGYAYPSPYDDVRQQEYEQLHHQMQLQQQQAANSHTTAHAHHSQSMSMGVDLLDRVFGVSWDSKCREIRDASPYGHLKGWRLASFIMKAGEDIRKEALVMQIISKLRSWFKEDIAEEFRPFMRPYTIMCVGGDAGLLECLKDVKSVDEVKKRTDGFDSLRKYFERAYGPPQEGIEGGYGPPPPSHFRQPGMAGAISFETAQDNFLRSLVGYSLVCYILQIKDRHNANILLDREGHIMHIDFGFVLGEVPKMGRVPIFSERAPFKLSSEFWEVLGGWNISSGGLGVRFCKMFELAFASASAHADEIATLVEGAMLALNSSPSEARSIANGVRYRLRMRGPPGSIEQKSFIVDLVNAALTCWGTSTYDWLQRNMHGYQ